MTLPDDRLTWRKSSFSESQQCVEVGVDPSDSTAVRVRDTKARQAGTIQFSSQSWAALIEAIKTVE